MIKNSPIFWIIPEKLGYNMND